MRKPSPIADRRAFLASCAAPLLTPCAAAVRAAQLDAPISLERAADAYLEGDLRLAMRLLELAPSVMAEDARVTLGAWSEDVAGFSGEGRRRAVRRLQASAALALEIPHPLTAQGRSGAALYLDGIATTALKILKSREIPRADPPAGSDLRTPDDIRRRMALFRGRWSVACVQKLVNDRKLVEANAMVEAISLPDGDRALPEAHYLHGLIYETNTRLLREPRFPREDELLPPSRLPWINGQLGDAAGWYRRALDASKAHLEARLHLGRVELERGRHRPALDVLRPLRELQPGTWISGLAWLFTGTSHMALGSLDDAQQAFARASEVPEVWQSGRVALMQLALRRGDLTGAADTSAEFAASSAPTDDRPDAWLAYVVERRADDNAVLEPMREAILP